MTAGGRKMKREPFHEAAVVVSGKICKSLFLAPDWLKEKAQEIRIRTGRPVMIVCGKEVFFLREDGSPEICGGPSVIRAEKQDVEESFRRICGDSVYSHQEEIRSGYITIRGGHRVGVCGTAVMSGGEISALREISSLNIRIAREVKGCSDRLIERLGESLEDGVLVAGPPSSGKTTLLRDLARQLASRKLGFRRVTVVDERGELAATYLGEAQNDLGDSDVLDGYPKGEGIQQAVRSFAPEFIICDELGGEQDCTAVQEGLNAGAAVIASIHVADKKSLLHRKQARDLLKTGAFGWVAVLGARTPGGLTGIYKAGELIAEMDRDSSGSDVLHSGGTCGIA